MRSEVITARTIDGAVERILEELKEDIGGTSSGRRHNVIYFDGWDGLGASAVLREVDRRLAPAASGENKPALAAGLEFSQIINLDCSKWESRRTLQRSLAEKLQIPPPVMNMFDAQDEEDDYNGVDKGSRAEIPQVADAIYRHIQKQPNSRFLVIFNNGSCKEINLESFGFPLSGYSRNKALWSFQGGFRLYPRTAVNDALESMKMTDVFLSAASDSDPAVSGFNLSSILHNEAAEIARKINIGGINWPAAATDCFLYMVKLCRMGSHLMDYDLAAHSCNYWKCDGIIQLQHGTNDDDDRVWLSCDALQHEMRLDVGYYQSPSLPSPVSRLPEQISYWTSPTCGFMLIPDQNGRIPKGMFQQYDTLRVLKLSGCTFSFTTPPFLCCHRLRFLWLDHCRDESSNTDGAGNKDDIRQCFQRLWVLDVRYSSSKFLSGKMMDFMAKLRELHVMGQVFDMMDVLQARLYNVRKLRVTKCMDFGPMGLNLEGKDKMEHLELSGHDTIKWLYVDSSCSSLETVIIDGSTYLQNISFKGCAQLKNLLLSGLFPWLYSLDITGAAVKTLDLRAVEAPKLDELILLGCGKLYAILWPPEDKRKRYLGKLRMDTTQQECSDTTTGTAAIKGGSPVEFDWYISVRDARILGSLAPVKDYFSLNEAHVVISTTPSAADAAGGSKGITSRSRQGNLQQHKDSSIYADVTTNFKDTSMHQQASDGDDYDAWAFMCTCPPPPHPPPYPEPPFPSTPIPRTILSADPPSSAHIMSHDCYMHIEDEMTRTTLQTASGITVPGFICDGTKALHVHDSLSISSISATPLGLRWNKLEWCRVERCPKLECVFRGELFGEGTSSNAVAFDRLRTIWASRLPNARYILAGSGSPITQIRAFKDLTLLHLYCCPRLAYACPFTDMPRLETLEIMWCGDLTVLFNTILFPPPPPPPPPPPRPPLPFPYLKHIHLHELPKLHAICQVLTIFTPRLETLKIRGCWSLRTLPIIDANNAVECDCEKEWWDRLQWDSWVQPWVQPGHYKPTHSRYYKKRTLRGSPLR